MKILLFILCFFCLEQVFCQVNIRDLQMENGKWFTKTKALYSGDFIAYYENGKLQGEGTMKDGLFNGVIVTYDENGNKSSEITFKEGSKNGSYKEYFESGNLKQEVNSVNNKDDGKAIVYYETGEKHIELNFDMGVQVGDYIEYNKQGAITRKLEFVNGKASFGKQINDLVTKANEKAREFKSDDAITLYTKAINLNPSIAELYFDRGAAKGNKFDMDGAILDYNKAIELYPDYKEAYANRGIAKINQYTTKGIIEPTAEQSQSACEDLYKAKDLGDGEEVEDMIYVHCERNHIKPSADTSNNTDDKPLMFLDGKKLKESELSDISPNDILEIEVLKQQSATAKYGPTGKKGVVLITSIKYGLISYQKLFSSFSNDYEGIACIPDQLLYQINNKLLEGKKSDIIGKLYHLKAEDIKSVSVIKSPTNQNNAKPTVNIITKN